MKAKTRGDDTDSPWGEVRHSIGRLLSYYIAIKVRTSNRTPPQTVTPHLTLPSVLSARKYWPQLFVLFEVTTLPSSTPLTHAATV